MGEISTISSMSTSSDKHKSDLWTEKKPFCSVPHQFSLLSFSFLTFKSHLIKFYYWDSQLWLPMAVQTFTFLCLQEIRFLLFAKVSRLKKGVFLCETLGRGTTSGGLRNSSNPWAELTYRQACACKIASGGPEAP